MIYCLDKGVHYIYPNNLEDEYVKNYIDLKKIDKQYSKWQLISIDSNIVIRDTLPSKIYDRRINSLIYLPYIDLDFLKLIITRIDIGEISKIAFRPNYFDLEINREDYDIALEAVHFGKQLEIKNIHQNTISKLVTDKNDSLWVTIEANEITFEELLDEEVYDGEYVRTNMIHLTFFESKNKYYIDHIDFEIIYYTIDEYVIRLDNIKQKGEIKTRNKIFKIDKSKIPLLHEKKNDFLILTLNNFFNRLDLINEYFEKI